MADGHVTDNLVEKQSGMRVFVVVTWGIYGPRKADNIVFK